MDAASAGLDGEFALPSEGAERRLRISGIGAGPSFGSVAKFGDRRARPSLDTAAIRSRPSDLSSADQDPRYGLELRIEPLEMMTDFRHEPARKIAVRLRERAALLDQAAASLE